VNKGELIGYVAEPSKYYVVEGPNVYFQMLKDGKPVNPLEYMGV
jgi:murein DD-endopeptidase MepM/ murein hydrolase activator NlpD